LVYFPLGRETSLELRGTPAGTSGDFENLSGLNNTHIGFTYHLERPDIVFTLGAGLPTGKKKLTQEQFETSILISNQVFGFNVPNFGEGMSVDVGGVWAIPLSDDVVTGLGAAYHYRGGFDALEGYDEYDPGDEFLATGGFDFRLAEATTLSTDLSFTSYSRDKLGDEEVFASGGRFVASIQFAKAFGENELWAMARFRSKGKGQIALGGILTSEDEKTEPNQFDVQGSYSIRTSDQIIVTLMLEGRAYEETVAPISGVNMFGFGLAPQLSISSRVNLRLSLMYRFGTMRDSRSINGLEIGAGVVL
jgi:hypothetical protein